MTDSNRVPLESKSLSEQVYEYLLQQILDNEYPVGSQIPTEAELQEIFGVSRTTVREAVLQLQAAGYLRREQGRGTFVQSPLLKEHIRDITSFEELVRHQGMVPSTKVISCTGCIPPIHIAEYLELKKKDEAVCIIRLRMADGERVCLARDYVPASIAPELCDTELEAGSLYRTLERIFQITLVRATEEVEAVIPPREDRRLLGMGSHMPALFLRRTTLGYLVNKPNKIQPVHYVETTYRSDRFRYVASLEGRESQPSIQALTKEEAIVTDTEE